MLSEEAYNELEDAVGSENVSRDPAIMDGYTFQTLWNTTPTAPWAPCGPEAVILPKSTEEVQAIVETCNKHKIKFKALSTGWGIFNAPTEEGVIQIDLRRMDRILEIDEKNMYVVVEPYAICAQVQAETMKKGLNLNIIGAGSSTSPLASCTSLGGMGWTSISTSNNCRNVLGVEWVLPSGDILRLGSVGSEDRWFCGDGPGPSLRGIMRGALGAMGGLGVFTKCALKLYPWSGPPSPKIEGLLLDTKTEIPDNFKTYLCLLPSFERYADATYKIADAEVGFVHCKNAIGLLLGVIAPSVILRVIPKAPNLRTALNAFQHMFQLMIAANSQGELEYQEEVLKKIISETEGVLIDISGLFSLHQIFWWGLVRASMPALIFRTGGSFYSTFGADGSCDIAVDQARVGSEIKQEFIDKGVFFDDLADNAWGGLYEDGLCLHQEELALFDPRNMEHREGAQEYAEACVKAGEKHGFYGTSFGIFEIPDPHDRLGPLMGNYQNLQRKIKKAFDPENTSDPSGYI